MLSQQNAQRPKSDTPKSSGASLTRWTSCTRRLTGFTSAPGAIAAKLRITGLAALIVGAALLGLLRVAAPLPALVAETCPSPPRWPEVFR